MRADSSTSSDSSASSDSSSSLLPHEAVDGVRATERGRRARGESSASLALENSASTARVPVVELLALKRRWARCCLEGASCATFRLDDPYVTAGFLRPYVDRGFAAILAHMSSPVLSRKEVALVRVGAAAGGSCVRVRVRLGRFCPLV